MYILWYIALTVVVALMIVGDVRRREISNAAVLIFTGLVLLTIALQLPDLADRGSARLSIGAGLLAFVLGLLVYAQGLVGGGDVKLAFGIAAVETWFGGDAWFIYLGVFILAGLGTVIWLLRAGEERREKGIPMGPMLLLGVVPSVVGVAVLAAG